jgi:hypothetical protein
MNPVQRLVRRARLASGRLDSAGAPTIIPRILLNVGGGVSRERNTRVMDDVYIQWRQRLHAVLLEAFPTRDSLEHELLLRLDFNLEEVSAKGDNLSETVLSLIRSCEVEGTTEKVLTALVAAREHRDDLPRLLSEWRTDHAARRQVPESAAPDAPSRPPPSSVSPERTAVRFAAVSAAMVVMTFACAASALPDFLWVMPAAMAFIAFWHSMTWLGLAGYAVRVRVR